MSTLPIGLRSFPGLGHLSTRCNSKNGLTYCNYYTSFSSGNQELPLSYRLVLDTKTGKPISGYFVSPTVKGKIEFRDSDDVCELGFPKKIILSGHKEICKQHGFPQQIKVRADVDFETGGLSNIERFCLTKPERWEGEGTWEKVESNAVDPRAPFEIPLLSVHSNAHCHAVSDILARRIGTQIADSIINPPN